MVRQKKASARAVRAIGIMAMVSTWACSMASHSTHITTADAAITAAKEAWESSFEKNQLTEFSRPATSRFEPYTATLKDGVWTVHGTIPVGYHGPILESTVRQSDGSVSTTVMQIK